MWYSQYEQDKYINDILKKDSGIFIDIGAYDGVELSNSCFFERERNWTGICVEPQPDIFINLIKNRKCRCEQVCVSSIKEDVEFVKVHGYSTMLSGIKQLHTEHLAARIDGELREFGGRKETIKVKTIGFMELIKDISYIDYCSIDVEGGEIDVLSTIDFNKVKINILSIELNDPRVENFMKNIGYKKLYNLGVDGIFQHD